MLFVFLRSFIHLNAHVRADYRAHGASRTCAIFVNKFHGADAARVQFFRTHDKAAGANRYAKRAALTLVFIDLYLSHFFITQIGTDSR